MCLTPCQEDRWLDGGLYIVSSLLLCYRIVLYSSYNYHYIRILRSREMDVVYHRNCLDGIYASFLLELAARVIEREELEEFMVGMFKWRE